MRPELEIIKELPKELVNNVCFVNDITHIYKPYEAFLSKVGFNFFDIIGSKCLFVHDVLATTLIYGNI